MHQPQMLDDQPARPRRPGNAEIERGDIEAGRHVHGLRRMALRLLHHVDLQARHIAEGNRAPGQHRGHHQPAVRRGEGQHEQHGGE
ncbi:hypothetical protein D3C86_1920990 [compost metagenome]